jgi:hypothetical protein
MNDRLPETTLPCYELSETGHLKSVADLCFPRTHVHPRISFSSLSRQAGPRTACVLQSACGNDTVVRAHKVFVRDN